MSDHRPYFGSNGRRFDGGRPMPPPRLLPLLASVGGVGSGWQSNNTPSENFIPSSHVTTTRTNTPNGNNNTMLPPPSRSAMPPPPPPSHPSPPPSHGNSCSGSGAPTCSSRGYPVNTGKATGHHYAYSNGRYNGNHNNNKRSHYYNGHANYHGHQTKRFRYEGRSSSLSSFQQQQQGDTFARQEPTQPPPNQEEEKKDDTPEETQEDRKMPAQPNHNRDSSNHEIVDLYSSSNDDTAEEEEVDVKENKTPVSTTTITHIIFAIDFSGSMRQKDVQKGNGTIRRWDAVFECMTTFLTDQIATQQQQQQVKEDDVVIIDDDANDNTNATTGGDAIVSVVIFNDKAKTLLTGMPLVGDGNKVLKALETARKMHDPRGGTGFSAGFRRAKEVALTVDKQNKMKKGPIKKDQNVVLVFLSDGRPGDLQPRPPLSAQRAMQSSFRRNKISYPAAGRHIEEMKYRYGERFSLHCVCIYQEGKAWCKYLADRYKGTFHEPNLSMNDDVEVVFPGSAAAMGTLDNDDDLEEDEILEMAVKSQSTLIRERHNKAKAAGQVFSLIGTSTAGGSSMRSTFQSISSSVTAMRGSSRLKERQGVTVMATSSMMPYPATRMVLNDDEDKFVVPSGETPNGRMVMVSKQPFAQGGLRNVYRMQEIGKRAKQVAKESKHEVGYSERLRFHIETSKCQARAADYAAQFNKSLRKSSNLLQSVGMSDIEVLRAEVIRLKDENAPGKYRYLAVESELKGSYSKWNSNNGYVNKSTSTACLVAQAFSHFSYEQSKEMEMVVDIQGADMCYTDPQLHSQSKDFGRADRGLSGFKDFFKTHKCNYICQGLKLQDRAALYCSPVKEEPKN